MQYSTVQCYPVRSNSMGNRVLSYTYLLVQWCCKLLQCILQPEASYTGEQLCGHVGHPNHSLKVTLNRLTDTRVPHLPAAQHRTHNKTSSPLK
jgi:hypothetical protein